MKYVLISIVVDIRFNVAFFYAFVLMTWLKEIIGCSSGNREVIIVLKTVVLILEWRLWISKYSVGIRGLT